ncbi:protein kinase [Mesorhizobium sp. LHD-90]|uniref:protein kinase domain-containing protein n=1 Tax=Mesorhizobium sp. LHD-90 TaxID=3071414 RepID=UPI0027E050E7|nr:protein kinase [Mesorhizobium sp. LHD-90]MDQ6434700.1 protein kinase [Mesorhizobium sp. LHD-90]
MANDEKTTVMALPDPVAVGTQLSGTYELDERIAAGGMGEVFRGHNIQTGDPVAIKIVLPEFARDAMILSLFRKEASILNHLFHEAIVRYHVFAIDQAIGRPYLAMEFVDGLSLVDMFQHGPMAPAEARALLARLASGLAVAHEAGIVHRDLSPDNIILPGGKVVRAKIIDFGIARSATVGGETLLGGVFAGKYNFVSPEQLGMFGGEVTEQSDIYSLGLVMAAALRGAPLDMSGSQVDVIEKRRKLPDLSGIDAELRPVLEAMLQPDPSDRPRSMAEIADIVSPQRDVRAPRELPLAAPAPPTPMPPPVRIGDPTEIPALVRGGQPAVAVATAIAPAEGQPASESPFGPYLGPVNIPIPELKPAADAPRAAEPLPRRGRSGVIAAVLFAIAASGAGAAWYGGLLDRPTSGPALPPVDDKTTQPDQDTGKQPDQTPTPDTSKQTTDTDTVKPDATQKTDADRTSPDGQDTTKQQPDQADTGKDATQPDNTGRSTGDDTAQQPDTKPDVKPDTEPDPQPDSKTAGPAGVDIAAERLAWLRDYSGGDCFFATATSVNGDRPEIEGFGDSVDAFKKLLNDFENRFQTEPEIGVRLIRSKQCPVTVFLSSMGAGNPPDLSLVKYELADRDPMSGQVQIEPARQTYLLLVDHDGIAHNLDRILKPSGDVAKFSIALGLGTGKEPDKSAVPQVLLAFATSQPLDAMKITAPTPASDLLPRIAEEITSKQMEGAATARYFRIRG